MDHAKMFLIHQQSVPCMAVSYCKNARVGVCIGLAHSIERTSAHFLLNYTKMKNFLSKHCAVEAWRSILGLKRSQSEQHRCCSGAQCITKTHFTLHSKFSCIQQEEVIAVHTAYTRIINVMKTNATCWNIRIYFISFFSECALDDVVWWTNCWLNGLCVCVLFLSWSTHNSNMRRISFTAFIVHERVTCYNTFSSCCLASSAAHTLLL